MLKAEDTDDCEDDLFLPACTASKDSLSSPTLPSPLPSFDISLPSLSSPSPLPELGSTSRQHSSSRLTGTVAVSLFKDTRWIHFTAERSLSFGYPLTQMIPSGHRLTYKSCKLPQVIKQVLFAHGFTESKGAATVPSLVWTLHPISMNDIRQLEGQQRANHFLRIQALTHKGRLCENIQRMQLLKGFRHFDIIPKTFVLPQEKPAFENAFDKAGGVWIVKPACLSRGRGIHLIDHPHQIISTDPMVVSRYIEDPFCINGLKFDLRLYVLVTSFDPLRIYLFEEGLGRFASVPYKKSRKNMNNLSMHLTNYSFNKNHANFVLSNDAEKDNVGNKWSSSAVFRYLRDQGYDTNKIMMAIEDVIIKTIIAGEVSICSTLCYQPYHGNCFELLGFDILLDKNLRPWVLEVNLSPSLNCDTPLDLKIKSKLIADMFSLVGISFPRASEANHHSVRKSASKYRTTPTPYSKTASDYYNKLRLGYKLEETSVLVLTKGEHRRRGGFVRIFPTNNTWELYSSFLEGRTKQNYLLHRNLFPDNGKIKWPPSSVGTSLDISARLKSYIGKNPSSLRRNGMGLDPFQRIGVYLNKIHLDCSFLSSTIDGVNGITIERTTFASRESFHSFDFKIVISAYLRRLVEQLSSVDVDDFKRSDDVEKFIDCLTVFLKSVVKTFIIPDQFLSPSIRLRIIIQQLKDFVLTTKSGYAHNGDLLVKLLNLDITEIESIILSHNSSDRVARHLIALIQCIQHQRKTNGSNVTVPSFKTAKKYIETIAKKDTRCSSALGFRRKIDRCEVLTRPRSVNGFVNTTSGPRTMYRRSIEAEDSNELRLLENPYKSLLPSKPGTDTELSDETNRVISAALQRLSSRQPINQTSQVKEHVNLVDCYL